MTKTINDIIAQLTIERLQLMAELEQANKRIKELEEKVQNLAEQSA